jgi:hypothetical protein
MKTFPFALEAPINSWKCLFRSVSDEHTRNTVSHSNPFARKEVVYRTFSEGVYSGA